MKLNQSGVEGKRHESFRPLRVLLALAAAVAIVGCKRQPGAAGDINPTGHYALISVDGKPVPATVQHEGHVLTVKSGAFLINSDGTCVSQIFMSGRDVPIEVKAAYTLQGGTLAMKWQGAGTTAGTVEGDTFTMENEGMVFVYRK